MKKLTLKTLTLTNFKGQNFTLETRGNNADVFGDNATGKTTLRDAAEWLTSVSPSMPYDIKTFHNDGSVEHEQKHEVYGEYDYDGQQILLKKVHEETWTNKRKSKQRILTGHTTSYYFQDMDLAISPRAYIEKLSTISPNIEYFKILSDPEYFSAKMDFKPRRKILLDMAGGDIPDEDITGVDPRFSPLLDVLKIRTIDQHKQVCSEKKKALGKQLDEKEILIKEKDREIGEIGITGINHLAEIDKVNKWSLQVDDLQGKISTLKNNGALAELQNDLVTAETQLISATNTVTEKHNSDRRVSQDKLDGLKKRLMSLDAQAQNNVFEIGRRKEEIVFLESVLGGLKAEWYELKAKDKAFKESVAKGQCTCRECGDVHNLPTEKLEAITAMHNETQSVALAANESTGKAKRKLVEEVATKIISLQNANTIIEQDQIPLIEEISRLESSLHDPDGEILKMILNASPEIAEAREKINLISQRIQLEKDGVQDDSKLVELSEQVASINGMIEESRQKIALVESSIKAQDRKKELEAEQKNVAAEFERLEGDLFLMEEFTRAKVGMLEDKINGMFKMARFRMFENNINGGLQECCKVTFNGVPFESSLNNGARINVGLDIINTISKAHGLSLPIMIDNAESVTELIPVDAQVVRLVVSEPDKVLRVETANDLRKAA